MTEEQIDEVSRWVAHMLMQPDVVKVMAIPGWGVGRRAGVFVYYSREFLEHPMLHVFDGVTVEATEIAYFSGDIANIGAAACIVFDGAEFRAGVGV